MKKYIFLTVFFIALLSACSQTKPPANVDDNPEAKASQAIVEQYISAYKNNDADALLALYSDDYVFNDYGLDDGPWTKSQLSYFVREAMSTKSFKFYVPSYVITPDGRFAILDGNFSQVAPSTQKMVTVPEYNLLEFKDGKIIAESLFYNGEAFH
jgi:hypothetical protein